MIIWGRKTEVILIGTTALLTFNCCGVESAKHVKKRKTWFTLFFIKVFPMSTKYYVECVSCGAMTPTSKEKLEELGYL